MVMGIKWMSILMLQITLAVIGRGVSDNGSSSKQNFGHNFSVKRIESEDGDVIDCIDIYKQPAFNHPTLRNNKIQMEPTYDLTMIKKKENETLETPKKGKDDPYIIAKQLWQKSGSCPEGTIPIRRTQWKSQSKATPFDKYARKKQSIFPRQFKDNKNANKAFKVLWQHVQYPRVLLEVFRNK